jgi:hypothetical protein
MKTCNKCLQTKPLEQFHPSPSSPMGVQNMCKDCWKVMCDENHRKNVALGKLVIQLPKQDDPDGKVCNQCKVHKPLSAYRLIKRKNRHGNKCIDCINKNFRKWMRENRDKCLGYERKKMAVPEKRKRRKQRDKLRRNRDRIKERARRAVRERVKRGTMKRLPCEVCGNPNSQAHHHDYSKRFDVKWLCRKHHMELHRLYP